MDMPAFFRVGNLDSIESSQPIVGKLAPSQLSEESLEFLDVPGGEVPNIFDCEDDVLWLGAALCPPLNLFFALGRQVVGAFGAKEQVAAIGIPSRFETPTTLDYRKG